MAFNGESSEEGGRCLSFGALCERLDAIEETHGRVQARKARGLKMWEGKTKPEGHIADFLHIGDLLNREMYEDSRYRDLPGLQQPKALKNPHRRGAYDVFRLIMPDYDTDRVFGIREAFLVELLCLAYPTSTQGQKAQLRAWKQKEKNISAGHLTKVAYEVLFKNSTIGLLEPRTVGQDATLRQNYITIGRLNDLLDELARRNTKDEKARVLSTIAKSTSPRQMYWVTRIIQKKRPEGTKERELFQLFHEHALEHYKVCMNLKEVMERLADQEVKHPPPGIALGKAVKPMKAAALQHRRGAKRGAHLTPEEIFEEMTARSCATRLLAENKFDGWRLQVHISEEGQVWMYSRTGEDWVTRERSVNHSAMAPLLRKEVKCNSCILDTEWCAVDRRTGNYMPVPFSMLMRILTAIADEKGPDELIMDNKDADVREDDFEPGREVKPWEPIAVKDVLIQFVVFDVLWADGVPVGDRPLEERKRMLEEIISPETADNPARLPVGRVRAQVVALTPSRMPHQCAWVSSGRELSHLFEKTYLTGEEGLVVKDPLSRWLPDDRSGLWAKIKPENQGNTYDYDVVVLAGAYGSKQGSRGELTQFMVGVLERDGADGSGEKPRFLTYCRVANGLDTDDRKDIARLVERHAGGWVEEKPECVVATGREEKVDVWAKNPAKSVVLTIKGDLRFIRNNVFATAYSVRFPKVHNVRTDKGGLDIETHEKIILDARAAPKSVLTIGSTPTVRNRRTPTVTHARKAKVAPTFAESEGAPKRRNDPLAAPTQRVDILGTPPPVSPPPSPLTPARSPAPARPQLWLMDAASKQRTPVLVLKPVPAGTEEAVSRAGGRVVRSWVPGSLVVSGLAPGVPLGLTAEARAEASRNHTVMDVSWLLRSVEAGRELPTQARDFLFKGTKHARLGAQHGLMETDCYRDEMFESREEEWSVEDLKAVMRWMEIDGAVPQPPELPPPPAEPGRASDTPSLTVPGGRVPPQGPASSSAAASTSKRPAEAGPSSFPPIVKRRRLPGALRGTGGGGARLAQPDSAPAAAGASAGAASQGRLAEGEALASERGTDGEWKRVMELCGQGYAKERIERETEEAVERLMEEDDADLQLLGISRPLNGIAISFLLLPPRNPHSGDGIPVSVWDVVGRGALRRAGEAGLLLARYAAGCAGARTAAPPGPETRVLALAGLPAPHAGPAPAQAVIQAAVEQSGGSDALAWLRQGLEAGTTVMADAGTVAALALRAIETHASGAPGDGVASFLAGISRASTGFSGLIAPRSPSEWPWDAFGVSLPSKQGVEIPDTGVAVKTDDVVVGGAKRKGGRAGRAGGRARSARVGVGRVKKKGAAAKRGGNGNGEEEDDEEIEANIDGHITREQLDGDDGGVAGAGGSDRTGTQGVEGARRGDDRGAVGRRRVAGGLSRMRALLGSDDEEEVEERGGSDGGERPRSGAGRTERAEIDGEDINAARDDPNPFSPPPRPRGGGAAEAGIGTEAVLEGGGGVRTGR